MVSIKTTDWEIIPTILACDLPWLGPHYRSNLQTSDRSPGGEDAPAPANHPAMKKLRSL
jgi:hypothetical protein